MSDHKIDKPNLFISHASSDGQFADVLKSEIEKVFADGIRVFCTSSIGAIGPSNDWLQNIEQRLDLAQAVIAIVTPLSIERPWLWFEIGATWLRARKGQVSIYPLCAPEIDFSDLPSPLDRLQALSMGKAVDLKLLFENLIAQFGFGKISSFRAANIQKRIPKYKTVKITEADQQSRGFYRGPYTGYSDDEFSEVLRTEFFHGHYDRFLKYNRLLRGQEQSIFNGKLVHFREVDSKLQLPPSTSARLLVKVAGEYGLEPYVHTDNLVRFTHSDR